MNGAEAIMHTLADGGVSVLFANPGTTEMHLVDALEREPRIRPVLALFEGTVSGAADGYARMTGRPAATLLHLGPGLGNAVANFHNARRAASPIVNLVGDHATYHVLNDPPLASDIAGLASTIGAPVVELTDAKEAGAQTADALSGARVPPGSTATVIIPADVSWSDGATPGEVTDVGPLTVAHEQIAAVADVIRSGRRVTLVIGGTGCSVEGLEAAGRLAEHLGVRVVAEPFPARIARGGGVLPIERLLFAPQRVLEQLGDPDDVVLAGATTPVAFFAYPDTATVLVPDGAATHTLATAADDVVAALAALADELGAGPDPAHEQPPRPDLPDGRLTLKNWADVLGVVLPDGAIVCEEAISSGGGLTKATAGVRHDLLTLTGGAIGWSVPASIGAAVAAPDRPVVAVTGDGSLMYTVSGLWTQAREHLDVTTIVLSNGTYEILRAQLPQLDIDKVNDVTASLTALDGPAFDVVAIAQGFGVPATRASSASELADQLRQAFAEPGPHLVDARLN